MTINKNFSDALFVFVFAALYSLLEIEMEGKWGWCKFLPTTNVVGSHRQPGQRGTFTMYHVVMAFIIILVIFDRFYTSENRKRLEEQKKEKITKLWEMWAKILFFLFFWFLLEDTIWFLLNPYFSSNYNGNKTLPYHWSPFTNYKRCTTSNCEDGRGLMTSEGSSWQPTDGIYWHKFIGCFPIIVWILAIFIGICVIINIKNKRILKEMGRVTMWFSLFFLILLLLSPIFHLIYISSRVDRVKLNHNIIIN